MISPGRLGVLNFVTSHYVGAIDLRHLYIVATEDKMKHLKVITVPSTTDLPKYIPTLLHGLLISLRWLADGKHISYAICCFVLIIYQGFLVQE